MIFQRAKGNAAINETLNPVQVIRGYQLEEIRLHLSVAGGAGDLTVTLDANAGPEYDTVLLTQDMTLVKDLVWQPDKPIQLDKGDIITIAWENANGRTYGLETIFEGR